jgi:hypothetical protein
MFGSLPLLVVFRIEKRPADLSGPAGLEWDLASLERVFKK